MNYEPLDREQLEDIARSSRDIARLTKGQFDAFREAGFTEPQALRLTGEWLAAQLGGAA